MFRLSRVRFSRQPSTPVKADLNGIGRGLVVSFNPAARFDAARGLFSRTIGTPKYAGCPYGVAAELNTSGDGIYFPGDARLAALNVNQTTIMVLARIDSQDNYACLVGHPYDNGSWASPYHRLSLIRYAADNVARLQISDSGNSSTAWHSDTGIFTSTWAWYEIVRSGSVVSFYRDGVSYGGAGAGGDTSIIPDVNPSNPTVFLERASGNPGEGTRGAIAAGFIWARALSDIERSRIRSNPWSVCAEPPSIFVASFGASSSISASGGSATTGAAQPAIQYALAAIGVSTSGGSAVGSAAVSLAAAGITTSGGSAAPSVSDALAASGGSSSSGSAQQSVTVTIQAAGLVESLGQAGVSPSVLIQAAGAALSSGNAQLAVTALQAAAGSAQSGGNATWAAQIAAVAAGTVTTGGIANLSGGAFNYINAAGGSDTGGSAAATLTLGLQATGGSASSGSAAIQSVDVVMTAAGIVQSVGQGALVIHVDIAALGSSATAGAAVAHVSNNNYPLGRLPSFMCVTETPVFACVVETPVFMSVH